MFEFFVNEDIGKGVFETGSWGHCPDMWASSNGLTTLCAWDILTARVALIMRTMQAHMDANKKTEQYAKQFAFLDHKTSPNADLFLLTPTVVNVNGACSYSTSHMFLPMLKLSGSLTLPKGPQDQEVNSRSSLSPWQWEHIGE